MLLKGKNAVITGCARGIGKAVLETFAQNGANVWACVRKEDADFSAFCEHLAEENGVWIRPVCFDLAEREQISDGARKIASDKQGVDILVNNAGIVAESASFLMTSAEKMKSVFEVNFFAQIMLAQYIVRLMTRGKNGGSIVNVSSIAALDGDPGQLEYNSSKAALIGATRKLARELAPLNIRVNAIAPGIIETDMGDKIKQDFKEQILANTFMKRIGKPQEIANSILFLASGLSSYVTGQVIRADGGM